MPYREPTLTPPRAPEPPPRPVRTRPSYAWHVHGVILVLLAVPVIMLWCALLRPREPPSSGMHGDTMGIAAFGEAAMMFLVLFWFFYAIVTTGAVALSRRTTPSVILCHLGMWTMLAVGACLAQ